jgi:hypothetical protein
MANVKITQLSELFANVLAVEDVLPIVDLSANETKKVAVSSILTLAYANDFVTYSELSNNISSVEVRRDANTFYSYDNANAIISANLIPSTSYSIGSSENPWNNVYVANINLGSISIQQQDNALLITDAYNASVILDTSINNISFSINQVSSNIDLLTTSVNTIKNNVDSVASNVANIINGTTEFTGPVTFQDNIVASSIILNTQLRVGSNVTSAIGASPTPVFTFPGALYRGAELLMMVQDITNSEYQLSKILVVHNGNDVFTTEYGIIYTGVGDLTSFTASIDGSDVITVSSVGGSANKKITVASQYLIQ